jgi:protease-4
VEGTFIMKKSPWLACSVLIGAFFLFLITVGVVSAISSGRFGSHPVRVIKIEGGIFGSLDTLKEMEEVKEDDSIKVVVLRIDSPGGEVASSQEIYEEVLKLKKEKKVIVSMGTVAASGGYYIACAADKIVASRGTVTGSIGVIMTSFGVQDLLQKVSVENRTIKSGHFKDAGSPFRPMTDEEKVYFQTLSDDMYHQFLTAVSTTRNIPMEKMETIAQGKIYSGEQAKELGLIDAFGNLYDAIDLARKEAGLAADAKVEWPHEPSPFEKMFNADSPKGMMGLLGLLKQKYLLQSTPLWILNGYDQE